MKFTMIIISSLFIRMLCGKIYHPIAIAISIIAVDYDFGYGFDFGAILC